MESVGKNVADVEDLHKILNEDKSVEESIRDESEVYMSQPKAQLRSHDTQSTMAETETRTGTFAKAEAVPPPTAAKVCVRRDTVEEDPYFRLDD